MDLTERQQQIKARLDNGMGAKEVSQELGISRNAVYQQIQRMRRHGFLLQDYTPTGQPPREGYAPSSTQGSTLERSEAGSDFDANAFVQAFMAKEQRRKQLVRELGTITRRLDEIASELG